MCVVSMVMDHYLDKWNPPLSIPEINYPPLQRTIPQADIDEFYKLLERAREYDKKHNQPDCELEDKKNQLKKLAKELGIEISFPEEK